VVPAVGAVAAALVAAVSVCVFQVLRTIGILRKMKAGLLQFRREVEPLAREVVALAEEAATRAQGFAGGLGGGAGNAARR
jgi:hypothetical protein